MADLPTDPVEERDVQKLIAMLSDRRVSTALEEIFKGSKIDIQLNLDQLVEALSVNSSFRALISAVYDEIVLTKKEEEGKHETKNVHQ